MAQRIDPRTYDGVPLMALRHGIRTRLSMFLNGSSDTDIEGLSADYMGLAEKVGFDALEIKHFERQQNPTGHLLDEWSVRPGATVANLCRALLALRRYDVLEDVADHLEREVQDWRQRQNEWENSIKPLQDQTVSQSEDFDVDDSEPMVIGDVGSPQPKIFDAFVCYALEDIQFVKMMIEKLESPPHNLQLCIPERDFLPGTSENTITAKVIENRCKKVLVLVSPDYIRSPSCDFQTKFAQALSPGARSKRVIPVLLKNMSSRQIPSILIYLTWCDYTKVALKEWFWMRIASALRVPISSSVRNQDSSSSMSSEQSAISLDDIKLSIQSSPWSDSGVSSDTSSASPFLTAQSSTSATTRTIDTSQNVAELRPTGNRSASCVMTRNNNSAQDAIHAGPSTVPLVRRNGPVNEAFSRTNVMS